MKYLHKNDDDNDDNDNDDDHGKNNTASNRGTHLNKSVSDTSPTIFELPCCSTHTSRSARDDENFLTTDNKVSAGVQV